MEYKPFIQRSIDRTDKKLKEAAEERKLNFKLKLKKLFEDGKTPEDITIQEFAKILDINIEGLDTKSIKQKIELIIRRLFPQTTIPEFLDLQYTFYLEKKGNAPTK